MLRAIFVILLTISAPAVKAEDKHCRSIWNKQYFRADKHIWHAVKNCSLEIDASVELNRGTCELKQHDKINIFGSTKNGEPFHKNGRYMTAFSYAKGKSLYAIGGYVPEVSIDLKRCSDIKS